MRLANPANYFSKPARLDRWRRAQLSHRVAKVLNTVHRTLGHAEVLWITIDYFDDQQSKAIRAAKNLRAEGFPLVAAKAYEIASAYGAAATSLRVASKRMYDAEQRHTPQLQLVR